MGLGIAGAFEATLWEIDDQMTTHLVDHGLDILVFARLRSFLRQGDILAAALKIDQRRQQLRHGFAQQRVERRSQKRLLEPPLEMQQDFEYPVKQPEKHRQSALYQAPLGFRYSPQISRLADAPEIRIISTSISTWHRHCHGAAANTKFCRLRSTRSKPNIALSKPATPKFGRISNGCKGNSVHVWFFCYIAFRLSPSATEIRHPRSHAVAIGTAALNCIPVDQ